MNKQEALHELKKQFLEEMNHLDLSKELAELVHIQFNKSAKSKSNIADVEPMLKALLEYMTKSAALKLLVKEYYDQIEGTQKPDSIFAKTAQYPIAVYLTLIVSSLFKKVCTQMPKKFTTHGWNIKCADLLLIKYDAQDMRLLATQSLMELSEILHKQGKKALFPRNSTNTEFDDFNLSKQVEALRTCIEKFENLRLIVASIPKKQLFDDVQKTRFELTKLVIELKNDPSLTPRAKTPLFQSIHEMFEQLEKFPGYVAAVYKYLLIKGKSSEELLGKTCHIGFGAWVEAFTHSTIGGFDHITKMTLFLNRSCNFYQEILKSRVVLAKPGLALAHRSLELIKGIEGFVYAQFKVFALSTVISRNLEDIKKKMSSTEKSISSYCGDDLLRGYYHTALPISEEQVVESRKALSVR